MNLEQYKLVWARRIASNNLVWQTPTLASAAQAFLLTAALNPQGRGIVPLVLALFSTFVGLAAIQLMAKHRRFEVIDTEILKEFENSPSREGYSVLHGPTPRHPPATKWRDRPWVWLVNQRSSVVWMCVLCGFVALGLFAIVRAVVRLVFQISS
jgi:hypothetical protein